jgi:Tol biopolymer transport system component
MSKYRVSVDIGGGDPNGSSFGGSISADGRYVAFESTASDLVAGDGNGLTDVFVRDLLVDATARVSVDIGDSDPDGAGYRPSISGDGRFVTFESVASDLVPGDGNLSRDVFVRDLVMPATRRVSVDTGDGDANGASSAASMSADGRYVAFQSVASDLVLGDGNGVTDVFVRNLASQTTIRASVDTQGGDAELGGTWPSIDAHGKHVAFSSFSSDLVPGDGCCSDVFVRDISAGTTTRASVDTEGGDPNGDSQRAAISGLGRYVAFDSYASDLVVGYDPTGQLDVFIRRWE